MPFEKIGKHVDAPGFPRSKTTIVAGKSLMFLPTVNGSDADAQKPSCLLACQYH